ncbi:Hypothetical predicted protein [Octopus vulgaris]|uniref:Inorganic phosphate cotransporter n=1 Tax=Octopus vulgaris TaxID=6645 RepID=A0AA36BUF1_OCTVU|nr:Hypothetical predicted protein [Octopus vulgaris]
MSPTTRNQSRVKPHDYPHRKPHNSFSGIIMSFSSGSVFVNHNDIAPSYAGIVFGIANTFATTSGSISSLTTKALTPNGTQQEWQLVFVLCAAICVCGAILYATMARGEIQEWARSDESDVSVHLKDSKREKTV